MQKKRTKDSFGGFFFMKEGEKNPDLKVISLIQNFAILSSFYL